jgi:hypothetical protein
MRRPPTPRSAVLACAGTLALACGSTEAPPAPEQPALFEEELGDDVVPVQSFHTRYGFPGPWWKEGGRAGEFDRESRTCLRRSNQARRAAPGDERNEAAYRGFLTCMEELGWNRGSTAKKDGEAPTGESVDGAKAAADDAGAEAAAGS